MKQFSYFEKSWISGKIKLAFQSYARFSLIWLIFMFLFSIVEIAFHASNHILPDSFIKLAGWSWYQNSLFWISWLFPFALIYVVGYLISKKLHESFLILY